jgi:hypothetical protein
VPELEVEGVARLICVSVMDATELEVNLAALEVREHRRVH